MINQARFGAARIAAAAVLIFCFAAPASAANSLFFWHGVRGNIWSDGVMGGVSNWYSMAPPNGNPMAAPGRHDTARFAPNAMQTKVFFTEASAFIRAMLFYPNVETYQFILNGRELTIGGGGITNKAATTPLFIVNRASQLNLADTARIVALGAGSGASIQTRGSGYVFFGGTSHGGNADLVNKDMGRATFNNMSSAGSMFIANNGPDTFVKFLGRSTAGRAALINDGGTLMFNSAGPNNDRVLTSGSVTNTGRMVLFNQFLSITGQLRLKAAGTLTINYNDAAPPLRLSVDGDVRVAGGLNVFGDVPPNLRRFTLIHGRAARVGKFDKVTFSRALRMRNAQIVYLGSDVIVKLDRSQSSMRATARR